MRKAVIMASIKPFPEDRFLIIDKQAYLLGANLRFVFSTYHLPVGRHGISERTARNYCATGKIEGAFLSGKTWNMPADATLPKRTKTISE